MMKPFRRLPTIIITRLDLLTYGVDALRASPVGTVYFGYDAPPPLAPPPGPAEAGQPVEGDAAKIE